MKINTLKKLSLIIRCALVLSFVFLSTQVSYAQTCNDIVGPGPKVTNDTIILDIQSGTNDTTCFTLATPFATANDSLIIFTGAQYIGDSAYFFGDTCLVYQTVLSTVSRRDTLEIRLLLDGITSCDTIVVLATVHGINDTIYDFTTEDSLYTICDTDIIGIIADSVTVCQAPAFGFTTIIGGCITYIPNPDYYGNDNMCVVACKDGLCDTTVLYLTVNPVNDPIFVNNDVEVIVEDNPIIINPLINDGDPLDFSIVDSTSVTVLDSGSNGIVTAIDPVTGTISYQPNNNYIGIDSIVYAVCDTGIPAPVTCDTATIYITITNVNDTLPQIILLKDSSFTLCDTNLNGINADSVQGCGANFGSISIAGNCLTYTPSPSFSGNDTACMIVCNDGICDTTIVPIFVDPTPIIACKDTTLYVGAAGSITIDTSFVLDSVNDNNLDSVWLSQTTFGCINVGLPTQVTVYAMDSLGQVDSCIANLTLIDTLAPAVVCQNITVQLDATGSVTIVANDVDNGTSDNCQLQTLIVSQSTFDCTMLGDNNVSLIATDIYGNVDSCTAIITVQDTDAPILSCPGDQQDEVAITCEYVIPDYSNLYSATDNCDDNVITYTQTPAPGTIVDADDQVVLITITAADTSGNVSSCTFNLTLTCKKGVVIYDALTPNGDGDNETFIIDGIEEFPDATIKILNRWGNVVYESDKGYANDWDGTSNKGVTIGSNELPTGTYFYILDLGMEDFEGNQAFKGYIYLQR